MEQVNLTKAAETKRKTQKSGKHLLLGCAFLLAVILTASIAFAAAWFAAKAKYSSGNGHLVESIRQAREIIHDNFFYYDEEQEKDLADAALKAIASATGDLYAEYYTKEEYDELIKQNQRTFVGVGILTQINEDGVVQILDVYDDTPASEAGLLPGDILLEINGVAFDGVMTLSEFLDNVCAEDGASNSFVIGRGEEKLSFDIIVREVHTPAVSSRMLTDSIGYIHVLSFHGTCVDETKEAMKTLREAGMQTLVLDLRDNLGGSLYDAVDIADIFLPKNYIVTTLRARDGKVVEYKTHDAGTDIRMVLLVNGYSASASELVAGALKDHGAAYLIGTKTYGKGIVQSFYEIPETRGWIKITTDAYYTPNGVCVQDEGITPDLNVELSEEAKKYSIDYIPFELDTQLQAAIAYLED